MVWFLLCFQIILCAWYGYFTFMYHVHFVCVSGSYGDQKRALSDLKLKLQMLVSCCVGIRNQTWKKNQCSNHWEISSINIYAYFSNKKIAYSINFTRAQKRKNKGGKGRGRTSCFNVEILFTKHFFFISSLVDNSTHIYNVVWLLSLLYPLSIAPISVNPPLTTLSFAQISDCLMYGVT